MSTSGDGYSFSQDWFSIYEPFFSEIILKFRPKSILEIGSFEGRSTVFMTRTASQFSLTGLTCVDTCCGGTEHAGIDFLSVEQRFDANMRKVLKEAGGRVDFRKLKGSTKSVLPRLIDEGQAFDLVYVDGSHEPHNVLFDLVLAFELTVPGGVLIADDYKWAPNVPGQEDLFQMPKMAIDSFINCNFRWLELIEYPINQIYIRKR